jgi:hypothetical protein
MQQVEAAANGLHGGGAGQSSYRRDLSTNGHQNIASGPSRRHTRNEVVRAPTAKYRYKSDLVPDEPGRCSELTRLVSSRLADWAAI